MPVVVAAAIVVGELLHGAHSARALPIALSVAAAAVLWARRRSPAWTLAGAGALVGILLHVDAAAGAIAVLAPAVALYSFALTHGRLAQALAGLAAVTAVVVADLMHAGGPGLLQTLGHALLVGIPLLAAEQVRTHRSYLTALTDRLRLAEHNREQAAERRAEQERIRIARELHDVVAHTLTEINVQAGAAAERAGPGEARDALERIEQTSHGAIGELRAILGVLRDRDSQAAVPPAGGRDGDSLPRAPAPGIENITELIERARGTGLEARLSTTGAQPPRISDATSLAAYRIVQESLTNARRHAPGTPVEVGLRFDPTVLDVAIENRGSFSANGTEPGVGIAGMRERATALGGSFEAGATAGGFRVQAQLPYQPLA